MAPSGGGEPWTAPPLPALLHCGRAKGAAWAAERSDVGRNALGMTSMRSAPEEMVLLKALPVVEGPGDGGCAGAACCGACCGAHDMLCSCVRWCMRLSCTGSRCQGPPRSAHLRLPPNQHGQDRRAAGGCVRCGEVRTQG